MKTDSINKKLYLNLNNNFDPLKIISNIFLILRKGSRS